MSFDSQDRPLPPAPLVTVGMPLYNDRKYVATAIQDIQSQTFRDIELVISSNASTDGSDEICRGFQEKDGRIRFYRQEKNSGQPNFMFLMQQARGKYFMWAASDDRWDREFIATLVEALEARPECASAFSPFITMDEEERPLCQPQAFDFAGKRVWTRITKFNLNGASLRDGFFYGMFRREMVRDMRFADWWAMNAGVLSNNAYPILNYVLACGDCVLVGDRPLWRNRLHIHSKPRYKTAYEGFRMAIWLAFLLRKVNVFYASAKAVYRGSGSLGATLLSLPGLTYRCLADFAGFFRAGFANIMRRALRG